MKEIVIYGAGDYARKMKRLFFEIGVNVSYYCISKKKDNMLLDGVEIITMAELKEKKTDFYVFIATQSRISTNIILNELKKNNITGDSIFDCHDFIDNNIFNLQIEERSSGKKYCILCNNAVDKFEAYGVIAEVYKEHHIIGAGLRENCTCPHCSMGDRERWQYYVIKNYTKVLDEECSVLHFAPEHLIGSRIRENIKCDYYEGDIVFGRARHQIDITDIQFKNEIFDYVIANHVLEHISDDGKALQEMNRVLKKEGILILSFPICTDMLTYENPQITTREDCERYYGDRDHVRLYGYDFKERIEESGFSVEILSPKNILDDLSIEKYGYLKDDIIMLCKKQ